MYVSMCAFDFCVCISFYFCVFFLCIFIEIIFSLSCWFVLKRFTIQWPWVCWKEFVSFFSRCRCMWMCVCGTKGIEAIFSILISKFVAKSVFVVVEPTTSMASGRRKEMKWQRPIEVSQSIWKGEEEEELKEAV